MFEAGPRLATDESQEALPGIDLAIDMAEFRTRHVGQGVLDLEDVAVL